MAVPRAFAHIRCGSVVDLWTSVSFKTDVFSCAGSNDSKCSVWVLYTVGDCINKQWWVIIIVDAVHHFWLAAEHLCPVVEPVTTPAFLAKCRAFSSLVLSSTVLTVDDFMMPVLYSLVFLTFLLPGCLLPLLFEEFLSLLATVFFLGTCSVKTQCSFQEQCIQQICWTEYQYFCCLCLLSSKIWKFFSRYPDAQVSRLLFSTCFFFQRTHDHEFGMLSKILSLLF